MAHMPRDPERRKAYIAMNLAFMALIGIVLLVALVVEWLE